MIYLFSLPTWTQYHHHPAAIIIISDQMSELVLWLKISHILRTVKKNPWKSQEICQWWNELITTFPSKKPMRTFREKSITLIHVVNLCIWPGQIPPGCAIYPTCSHKHGGNLAKLNSHAVVRETQSSRLKMWTRHFWPYVKQHFHGVFHYSGDVPIKGSG